MPQDTAYDYRTRRDDRRLWFTAAGLAAAFLFSTTVAVLPYLQPDAGAAKTTWSPSWRIVLRRSSAEAGCPLPPNCCDASVSCYELQVGRFVIRWSHA